MSQFLGLDKATGHNKNGKTGVLLMNLGTPDQPTKPALKRYLKEFLSDPRVIEMPRLLWWLILNGIILNVRPKKSAKLYQSIWTDDGSPIMAISKKQQQKLADKMAIQHGSNTKVYLAMRYGNPSVSSVLQQMQKDGVTRIIALPLYPQYAAPTTGSSFDAIAKELQKWRWVPELHFMNTYHDNSLYVDALSNSINEHVEKHGKPNKFVFSYHGMPLRYLESGDPYYCFCQQTTRLVAEKLGLAEEEYMVTFQSRFGKEEWLKPYTDESLEKLAKNGVKHIAILSPAFSADCLETIEELEEENREVFMDAGGETYHYIPALNDRDDHIEAIFDVIKPYL